MQTRVESSKFKVDPVSLLAVCSADLPLKLIEKKLNENGLTFGYQPSRKGPLTLKKALDERVPNLYALKYGEIDDICLSVKVRHHLHKAQEMLETKTVPRSATGPDFKKIFIGSRGACGEIVEATLRVIPLPPQKKKLGLHWTQAGKKRDFLKRFWASGSRPAMVEDKGLRLLLSLEGLKEIVAQEEKVVARLAKATGGKLSPLLCKEGIKGR